MRVNRRIVAFLLVLYIIPLILVPSYGSLAIPTEPNTHKDFSIAEDWYDEGWHYRKSITIKQDSGISGTDYQVLVNVTYDSDMQANFDDILFTDNDKLTLLDHWQESYTTSTFGVFWVKVNDYMDSNSDTTIYMYYGNETASTASSGADTFVFYEDWTSETVGAQWTIENNDGSVSFDDTDANHGSVIEVEGGAGIDVQSLHSDDDFNSSYALRMRTYSEVTDDSSQYVKSGWEDIDGTGRAMLSSYQGVNDYFLCTDDESNTDNQAVDPSAYDSWHVFDIIRDGTDANLYVDGSLEATGSVDPDALAYSPYFHVRDSEYQLYNDWMIVRKYVVSDPYVDSFGEEESLIPPPPAQWNIVNSAELLFAIVVDETGLNMILIFSGLILIPASTLFLVKGGKDGLSSDKFFYFCIAFIMGWALFIGGIM